MKQITSVTTFVRDTVESFNQELAKYITKYQDEGKEVDIKFSINESKLAGIVIAYEDREETDNGQEEA